MRYKKWIALGLTTALLAIGGLAASAMTDAGNGGQLISSVAIPTEPEEPLPSFGSITGVVTDIQPLPYLEGAYHVITETTDFEVEEGEPSPVWFTVTKDTVFFDDARPAVGDTVTGFYDRHAPMLMIYPPQYPTVAMVVNPDDTNYFVGYFDEDLVDADNRLMLVIVEETQVMEVDGTPFEGSLKNQVLAVAYGASTRSIPAQTRPEKVFVIPREPYVIEGDPDEAAEEGEEVSPIFGRPITHENWMSPIDTATILVEDELLTNAPAPIMNQHHVIMVPLKHVAEALGFIVTWVPEHQVVMLSDSFTVTIGQDAYVDMSKDAPIAIGTAPVIHNNRTFVPLHFFRDVIPMNNAYFFENQIVIDNQEKMH